MRRVVTPVCHSTLVITGASVWLSNGLPCSALACSRIARPWIWWPGGDRHFAAELVRRSGLAPSYAFDLGGVQRIHLGPRCRGLGSYPQRQGEEVAKRSWSLSSPAIFRRMLRITRLSRQEFQFAPRPLELMGMTVPGDHDRRALGHPILCATAKLS